MRYWTETQRRAGADAFLATVQATQKTAEQPMQSPSLPDASLKLLIKAALEPGTYLLDMYRALGLHPAEGKGAQEDLIARGYARVHRLARKGRGGQPQVIEVTDEGAAVLADRGITPAGRLVKGGFKHDCYARLIGRWAAAQKFRVAYERTLGGKTFDLTYEDEQGRLHGVEVCLTGSASWTAQQLQKAASVAGVLKVLAGCETQAFAKSVAQELSRLDELVLHKDKIQIVLLAEFTE